MAICTLVYGKSKIKPEQKCKYKTNTIFPIFWIFFLET